MTQNNSLDSAQKSPLVPPADNAITIDLADLFNLFMRHIVLLIVVTLIFGSVTFFYYSNHTEPTYTSWFTGYVNNDNTEEWTRSEYTTTSLVSTYAAVITSKASLEAAAEETGIDKDYYALKKMVSTNIAEDTQIIYVYVSGKDANEVFLLAGALASTAQEQVSRVVDGTSMRIMDDPDIPEAKYNVSITKNTVIGAGVGFILAFGILLLLYLLDDRIRDDKTIEETLGFVVLGTIPDFDRDTENSRYGYKKYYHSSNAYASGAKSYDKQETGVQS